MISPLRSISSIRRVSSLSVTSLEQRWPRLPIAEQGAVAEYIYSKERGDWKNMSLDEKRASYYIAYGNYGPRTEKNPAHNSRVIGWVSATCLLSVVLWQYWLKKMTPKLRTETPEWREATIAQANEAKMNPFTVNKV